MADVSAHPVPLHGLEEVAGALDERQPGGLSVQAWAEGADHDVGSGDRGVDGVGIGQLANHDAYAVAPCCRNLRGVARVRGDGVTAFEVQVRQDG